MPNPSDHSVDAALLDGAEPLLWTATAHSYDEYVSLTQANGALFAGRRKLEAQLAEKLRPGAAALLPAYCSACRRYQLLGYDHLHSSPEGVNWRERLVCPVCQLNNRLRLSFDLFEGQADKLPEETYIMEALTPFAIAVRARYPGVTTSEYLGPDFSPGSSNRKGIRHEDVTALSFEDESFRCVMSFDVLEHVPGYRKALAEICRVLKPGGTLMLSVPFVVSSPQNIVRARHLADGRIEHLLKPEYHGDPVNPSGGILCYYHFGWELLQELIACGFAQAKAQFFWSLGRGHIGGEQLMLIAEK